MIKIQILDQHLRILIVGLGGGALAMYCKTWLKDVVEKLFFSNSFCLFFFNQFILLKCEIDAVEIDEKIARTAKDWFDLKEDERTRIHIANGLTFIEEASKEGKKWDVVIVDINCSDHQSDLWGPTAEFLENELLTQCKSILACPSGFKINILI